MAQWIPFCNLTNLFLSLSDENGQANLNLMNEIWGCVEYLKIPYETVMEMPVYLRKYWINKHNEKVIAEEKKSSGDKNTRTVTGDAVNAFARLEQQNLR